jgi:hypothetical protein
LSVCVCVIFNNLKADDDNGITCDTTLLNTTKIGHVRKKYKV